MRASQRKHQIQNSISSNMSKLFLFFLLLSFPLLLSAQEDYWDVYLAKYEKGPGSIMLNMDLKKIAPVKNLPFVLVTGVSFTNCTTEGLPAAREFPNLYKIADSVKAIVERAVKNKMAGSFSYQCQRVDYYYIEDTSGLRELLSSLYKSRFPSYTPYINIKDDTAWKFYLEFLYPNEETYEYMQNQKVLVQLQKAGDKLEKARQVDHWIYFPTEPDRNCFILYAKQNHFRIELTEKATDTKQPYKLQMSRIDKVDASSITRVTLGLIKAARKCNGDYDGWETVLVK